MTGFLAANVGNLPADDSERDVTEQQQRDVTEQQRDVISEQRGVISEPCDVTSEPCDMTVEPYDVTSQQRDVTKQQGDVTDELCGVTEEERDVTSQQRDVTSQQRDVTSQQLAHSVCQDADVKTEENVNGSGRGMDGNEPERCRASANAGCSIEVDGVAVGYEEPDEGEMMVGASGGRGQTECVGQTETSLTVPTEGEGDGYCRDITGEIDLGQMERDHPAGITVGEEREEG
eukprot:2034531-Rhodomonas_salina.1